MMKRRLRPFLYLVVVVVWLVVMSLPILAFSLAEKEDLRFGEGIRLFLLHEKDAGGVGVEWKRPLRQQPGCTRTTVTYLMWEGQSENTAFCQCSDGSLVASCR